MPKKHHIFSIIFLIGFTLGLTNGFADEDAFPWERVTFPTPQGDAYIQGTPEFQRALEAIIGTDDIEKMRDLDPDSQDYQLGRKVGMIAVPTRNDPDRAHICTGFLVGPNLFMTNHHCIHDHIGLLPLARARIFMDYYQSRDVDPTYGGATAGVSAVLRAEYFKDYALLRLDKSIGNTYGWLTLDTTTAVDSSQSVKLISHNRGRSKEIVRKNSEIVDVPAGHPLQSEPYVFVYLADSEPGSSGSPVFLRDGTGVIGINHSGWYQNHVPTFNAGSLMSYIVPEIQQWLPGGTAPPTPPKPSTKLMYWTDLNNHKIWRADLDGTEVQALVRTPDPFGLAADATRGKLYWIEGGTNKIRRANLDGTNAEDLVTAGLRSPTGLALDVASGKIYWTDAGVIDVPTNAGTGKIQRANLNGTNIQTLVTGLPYPLYIALDVAGGKMYWTDHDLTSGDGKIQRANLNGTNIQDLFTGSFSTDGIALDTTARKMYWTNSDYKKIQRANLNGTNVEEFAITSRPIDIALDVAAGRIYWITGSTGRIWSMNFDGSDRSRLVNAGSGFFWDIALYLPGQQAPRPRPPTQPPTFRLGAVADQTFTVGEAVDLTLPTATGGTSPYTYTLSPIPVGLRFDTATRVLSGTPTTATRATQTTYIATDANRRTASQTFRITVTGPPATEIVFIPPEIADQTFIVGEAVDLTLPTATGGTSPYTYSLSPLPAGLRFDTTTRVLSGTPTTATTATQTTYTATDTASVSASLTFTVTVRAKPTFNPSEITDQTFIVGEPVNLTLPTATGGTPPYTYTLLPIPAGLRFDTTTRVLSGTPITATNATPATYTATDTANVSASLTFTITVRVKPTFNPSEIADQTFITGEPVNLTLPTANGSISPYTYSLAPLPAGLRFDTATRVLSGTPTTAISATQTTYTVTDAAGVSASLTFTITVRAKPTFNPSEIADQTFIVGEPVNLTLPTASGSTSPYTYTLAPLPEGLSFSATERELSGTPTTAETITATYTATDAADVSASLTFTMDVVLDVDVNDDGQTTVIDLAIVALFYGTQVPADIRLPADVNADGMVDILDLTAVAQGIDTTRGNPISVKAVELAVLMAAAQAAELDTAAGAPRRIGSPGTAAFLSVRSATKNVADALATARTDGRLQKGVVLLEKLLTLLTEMSTIPETTALLPNYPNPFNPETWIPYHLAKATDVTLTIHDIHGRVVRILDFGHQQEGIYQSRGRAAYWDGKNELGEKVASGVYFYTLTAGDFTATRKLLIAK